MASRGAEGAGPTARRRAKVPILVKVIAALIIPLVAVGALSWVQISQARDRVTEVDQENALARVALSPGGLVHALTVEQGDATMSILGGDLRASAPLPTKDWAESKSETDAALETLRRSVTSGGPAAEAAYADVIAQFEAELPRIRALVDEVYDDQGLKHWDLSQEIYAEYHPLAENLEVAADKLAHAITDPDLREAANLLAEVNESHAASSRLTRSVGTSIGPGDQERARNEIVGDLVRFREARQAILNRADGPWASTIEDYRQRPEYQQLIDDAEAWLYEGVLDLEGYIALNPAVPIGEEPEVGSSHAVAVAAETALGDRADQLRDEAEAEQRRYTLISAAVLLGGIAIAALLARSITKPMMSLTRQADQMASTTLPETVQIILDTPVGSDVDPPVVPEVSVRTMDETGLVAHALNEVQRSAVGLAVEQATLRHHIADSFVSMGRRTQNLIGLQLELITELEHEETDPTTLEHLYRLDHLATRARRNAESLVVLAGSEPPRSGSSAVEMSDILRATLSEVEAYQRVEITSVDDAMVPGGLAADLVHLLAELVENGLSFSPPSKTVEVVGRRSDTGYLLTVIDQGVGMVQDKIDQANRRLAGEDSFTVAPSRYLGHYVTGKLALRVGAKVELRAGREGGLVATVELPASALTSAEATTRAPGSANDPAGDPISAGSLAGATLPDGDGSARQTDRGIHVDGRPPSLADAIPADAPRRRRTDRPHPTEADQGRVPATPVPAASAEPEVTDSGLRRRVPGQHAQVTDRSPKLQSGGVTQAPAGVSSPAETQNLASLLTAYTSGVERGRDELDNPDGGGDADGSNPSPPATISSEQPS